VLIYRAWLAAAGQAASGIRALPAADSTMRSTRSLQPPQPVPARVAVAISCSVRLPEVTHESMSALLTPLQLQTWVSGASSSSRSSVRGWARSNSSDARLWKHAAVVQRLGQERHPVQIPEQDRAREPAVADDHRLVDAALRLARQLHARGHAAECRESFCR
jgi:hypothetical protein